MLRATKSREGLRSSFGFSRSGKSGSDTEKIEKYKNYQKILVKLSLLVTILGFLVYLGEKKYEYGNSFKFSTFISGVIKCKGDDLGRKPAIPIVSGISIIDSLKKSLL
jgi:hypothetical protein